MNRKTLAALPLAFALASCGNLNPQQTSGVMACVASLPISGKVDALLAAAEASPACRALAEDALRAAIREAMLRTGH